MAQVNYTKLLGASVLGDGLGALRHSMFSQLSWKEKPHSSLDLTRGDRRPTDFDTDFKSNSYSAVSPLVVVGQFAGLCSDPLKQIIHEGVHDGHGFG